MTTKHDAGKLRWDLLPLEPMRQVVRVLGFGAEKYGEHNWRTVTEARKRYFAAAMRHLTDWYDGEPTDAESGIAPRARVLLHPVFDGGRMRTLIRFCYWCFRPTAHLAFAEREFRSTSVDVRETLETWIYQCRECPRRTEEEVVWRRWP